MQRQQISIECFVDDLRTHGVVHRRDFTPSERWSRGGKTFGILFLVAMLSIFVPLLHFILPPIFLIAGTVLGVLSYLETSEVLDGEVGCPNCQKLIHLPREAEEWPKIIRCPGCSFSLTVKPAQ